jgi:hypothetical protein
MGFVGVEKRSLSIGIDLLHRGAESRSDLRWASKVAVTHQHSAFQGET